MNKALRFRAGFTLIELMVTMAVAAVLLMVAAPSFIQFQRNSELTSLTNSLVASINAARTEAMKTGRHALFTTANDDNDWSKGWIVFVDLDGDNSYSSDDTKVMERESLPSYITISGTNTVAASPGYIRYDGSGFSKPKSGDLANSTFNLSRNDVKSTDYSQIRRIKIAITGRVRVCTPQSSSDSACSTTGD